MEVSLKLYYGIPYLKATIAGINTQEYANID